MPIDAQEMCQIENKNAYNLSINQMFKKRNENLSSGYFYIPESRLVEWFGVFQPPDADELSQ